MTKRLLRFFLRFILLPVVCVGSILLVFYLLFGLFIRGIEIDTKPGLNIYQLKHLTITYISSCVTTLALIVALLKDEIRSLWSSAKISIRPKEADILMEYTVDKPHKRAEYYYVGVQVINDGSLHALNCYIILSELRYCTGNDREVIDISEAEEISWTGKGQSQTTIHANGAKMEAMVIEIRKNDASNVGAAQSSQHRLLIGGIDVTKKYPATSGCKWIATFTVYSQASRHKRYTLEIDWDGKWHDRVSEMKKNCKLREIK